MKRMCKFIFGIIFSIFMMGIISCSGQDESTNLTIAIDMSGLLPSNESKDSFARSVNDEKDDSYEINLINLETNEKYPKTGPIINNEIHVTFEKVPLFFYGKVTADIKYKGTRYFFESEEFTVHERITRIILNLIKVDNPGDDPTEPGEPEDSADPNDPNQPGDGTGEGSGDTGGDNPGDDPEIGDTEKTAKYTVKHYQQNAEDDEYTLVETDTENKTGIVGAETSAEAKNYEGFEVREFEQAKIAADGSTEIKIYYDRNRVTLTFETDDGSVVGTIPGKYGAKIQFPSNPTKDGYIFDAWDPELPETFPATDTTFIAQWTPISYTVVFDANGGNALPSEQKQILTYDESQKLMKNVFTREGYTFVRWNTQQDGLGTPYADEQEVKNLASTQDDEVTLYAQWEKTNIEVLPPSFTEDPVSINKTIGYDNKITFTVVGLDRTLNLSFTWYIDDELVGTGESLTINPDDDVYPAGAYSIRVIVTDENGNVYSAMYDFELIK